MHGKLCPNCGNEIGFWSVFRAAWPTRIRCPRCKSKIGYAAGHAIGIMAVLIAIAIAVLAIPLSALLAQGHSAGTFILVWGACFVVMYELFLLFATVLLRRYGRLVTIKAVA